MPDVFTTVGHNAFHAFSVSTSLSHPSDTLLPMDTLEIIRQLQQDPALKAELRAVLLGEEILSLPDLVRENSRQIAENSRQIAALTERMDRVEAQIAALVERMDQVERRLGGVEDRLGRVEDRLGHLDGRFTEEIYRRAFATKVADIEGKVRRVKVLSRSEQADLSFDAADEDLIDEVEALELRDADVVAEGRIRSTGEEVTLVAEISYTVHIDDVLRAIKRAEIASRATNRRSIPVVMGEKADYIKDVPHSGVWLIEKNQTRELLGEIS